MTWDDHETENDYAGFIPENAADPADNLPDFASRRARAYQVYYEHMPLRAAQVPIGPYLRLYRQLRYGDLLSVNVLDTRQYRSARAPEACALEERIDGYCPSALDPSRTIEGQDQQAWLMRNLRRSTADWNLLANQVPFAPNDTNADPLIRTFGGEKWDGYPLDRQKILDVLAERRLGNTIVITGDVHANFVRNVPPDHIRLDAEPVATEFVGHIGQHRRRSHAQHGVRQQRQQPAPSIFGQSSRLRAVHRDTGLWRADYRVVPSVVEPVDGGVSTLASFVVEKGRAGAIPA